jgi:hypothetical protein
MKDEVAMANGAEESLEEKKEALRESVERGEQELRLAVDELTTAAQSRLDLGEKIADSPWPWLVGGFALGFWLSRR